MNSIEDNQKLRFAYPDYLKWFFGVGWVFLFTLSIAFIWWLRVDYLSIGLFAIFFVFGCLSFWYWFRLQGVITVDSNGISLFRFGSLITISYDQITKIAHHPWDFSLTIQTDSSTVKIEKQLQSYPVFYRYIAQKLQDINNFFEPLPLKVFTRRWFWFFYGGLAVVGMVLIYQFFYSGGQVYWMALIAVICLSMSGWSTLTTPKKFVFEHDKIEVLYFSKRQSYMVADLKEVALQAVEYGTSRSPLQLKIIFATGKIEISELAIDYPLEKLAEELTHYYLKS